jgi:hypothetical protein
MKLLPIFFLTFLPIPAQAITWKEFWEPFVYERPYYNYREYISICREHIVHEEYIPGNRWRSGYVRRWTEVVRVPCDPY